MEAIKVNGPAARRRPARWMVVVTALVVTATAVVLLAVTAGGGRRSRPAARLATPLAGTFTLWAATPRADPCRPRVEAPDIHAGAAVEVRDEHGTTVATST